MRSSLLLLFLLLPSLAAAQILTLAYPTNLTTTKTLTVGRTGCGGTVTVNWTFLQNSCGAPLDVWVVDAGTRCGDAVPSSNVFVRSVTSAQVNAAPVPTGGTGGHASAVTFTLDEVFAKVSKSGSTTFDPCGRESVQETRTFNVCASTQVVDSLNNCSTKLASSTTDLTLVYDHEKPSKPVPVVRAGERSLVVTLPNAGADIASFSVSFRKDGEATSTNAGTALALEEFEIKGLENNTKYFVVVTQTDLGDNVSDPSDEVEAMPRETTDFWEYYQGAGGTDGGGCGVAGGAGLSLGAALAVVGLWLASRRRAS